MKEFSFEATGTQWAIVVDQEIDYAVFETVKRYALEFEEKFSRFKETSEIGKINRQTLSNHQQVTHTVSLTSDLAEMLRFGKDLQDRTDGAFDLNVANLLIGHGYDVNYSFVRKEELLTQERGIWSVDDTTLTMQGLVQLDLGAFGKGKLIDQIAGLLHDLGIKYYLIDGGRDFYGTSKVDGSAWVIGLEHPFDATMAIGEFPLLNCALACSGISQRKVKDFHHFIDTRTGNPVAEPVGVFVQADSCMVADGVSTAIAVSDESYWEKLVSKYGIKGCVVRMNGIVSNFDLVGLYN